MFRFHMKIVKYKYFEVKLFNQVDQLYNQYIFKICFKCERILKFPTKS